MPFVKLDCGILNSTLWFDKECRDLFVTALLMAVPHELEESAVALLADSLEPSGFVVPPGWYGFVASAGVGIIAAEGRIGRAEGLKALQRLGDPDAESRGKDFDGRRLVRVDGGFLVLNWLRYRERDTTAAERQARFRARHGVVRSGGPKRKGPVVVDSIVERGEYLGIRAKPGESMPAFTMRVLEAAKRTQATPAGGGAGASIPDPS